MTVITHNSDERYICGKQNLGRNKLDFMDFNNCKVQHIYLNPVEKKKYKAPPPFVYATVIPFKAGIAFCCPQNPNTKVGCPDMQGL